MAPALARLVKMPVVFFKSSVRRIKSPCVIFADGGTVSEEQLNVLSVSMLHRGLDESSSVMEVSALIILSGGLEQPSGPCENASTKT